MKIITPTAKYISQGRNVFNHIAYCARICYASDKTTDNEKMCERLWNQKHRSMFRHAGCYYIIPKDIEFKVDPRGGLYCNVITTDQGTFISCNMQYALEHMRDYDNYQIDWIQAMHNPVFYKYKMLYFTFEVETGIDITRELNRKSPNAIAERSTRYVDFIKKIGIQFKECHWMAYNKSLYKTILYKFMCKVDEWFYKIARSEYGLNLPPQDARFCLFLDTMSKAIYTYTAAEWEDIINLRLFDYTGPAHPDVKVVVKQIYDYLTEEEGYTINDYKEIDKKIEEQRKLEEEKQKQLEQREQNPSDSTSVKEQDINKKETLAKKVSNKKVTKKVKE